MNAQPGKYNAGVGGRITAPQSVVQRLLLACGIVGPVLFIVVFLVEGATRPGYNSLMLTISALESGPSEWMQVTNFIVFGLFIGCFAIGLRGALVRGFGATLLPLLEIFTMLGLIGDGIFLRDPLHLFCDILALAPGVVASFVFAWRLAGDPRWRGWATYSIATAILTVLLLITFGVELTHNGPAGLFEKLAVVVRSTFGVLLTMRLLAGTSLVPLDKGSFPAIS